jgi:hypothetical protein
MEQENLKLDINGEELHIGDKVVWHDPDEEYRDLTRVYEIFDIQGDIISISDEYGESEVYSSELKKVFISKNNLVTLCRQDYYTFPIPMEADYFNDEKMQELVDTIGVHIERDYRFTKQELDDFNNDNVQDVLWELIESVALDMGMVYCQDKE